MFFSSPILSLSFSIGRSLILLNVLFCLLFLGCAHDEKALIKDPELLWKISNEAYENRNWMIARERFTKFKRYHPQDARAALARLRVADTYFEEWKYFDAEIHYEDFIELHPDHPEVAYAWYQRALSQKKQVPGIVVRDLTKAKESLESFNKFLTLKGADENDREIAKTYVKELELALMKKEFEIGSWYFKLGHSRSAFYRFEKLLKDFIHLRQDHEEILYLSAYRMIRCAIQLRERDLFQEAKRYLDVFKEHRDYRSVKREIDHINFREWQ